MSSVQFIAHKNKQILLMDFSGAYTKDELTGRVEEAKKIVALHQPKSLFALADFSGLDLNVDGRKIIKDMSAHYRHYVRYITHVGLDRWRAATLNVMFFLKGNKNHRLFKDRETALDWLSAMYKRSLLKDY